MSYEVSKTIVLEIVMRANSFIYEQESSALLLNRDLHMKRLSELQLKIERLSEVRSKLK